MNEYEKDPIAIAWRRRWLRRFVVIGGGLGAALFSLACISQVVRPGVRVVVKNAGTKAMRSVVLQVTGQSVDVGNIASGDVAQGTVHPMGDSGLQIEFSDIDGKQHSLDVDCYLERGNRGVIQVSIKDGHLDKTDQRIDVSTGY